MTQNGADMDDVLPHDPERSESQVRGLLAQLAPAPKHILELGCGNGRVLLPLAQAGHHTTGIERSAPIASACRAAAECQGVQAEVIEDDFVHWLRSSHVQPPFDAIICVGNTFMTLAKLDDAIDVLTHARRLLAPGGVFIMDDLPHDLWPELTEGNWQAGVAEDGSSQLLWHPSDAVFTIRQGDRVDTASWTFKPDDVQYRLWTSSGISMAARLAGLSEPTHIAEAALLILRA